GLQAIHRLFVSVESDELAVVRYVDFVAMPLQAIVAAVEALLEDIGHGDQFHRTAGGLEGIGSRAAAAPAATDQSDLNEAAAGGMNMGQSHARQSGSAHDRAGRFNEVPAGGQRIGTGGIG